MRAFSMVNRPIGHKEVKQIEWRRFTIHLVVVFSALMLFACGGGSSGGGGDTSSETTYTLSGAITSANNIAVDSDLNDPNAPYANNDDVVSAQLLQNPVMLNGFVSDSGTGLTGDRFATTPDANDIFRATLYFGQYVSLRIANFDAGSPEAYDVDIYIYDENLNFVVGSDAYDVETESVLFDQPDGEYYIQVRVWSGVNKYVLSIGSTSLASTNVTTGPSGDFVPYQAIIKRAPSTLQAKSSATLKQLSDVSLSHNGTDRNALLKLSPNSSLGEVMSSMSAKAVALERDDFLQSLPDASRQKIETLRMIKQLKQREDIESASPNYIYRTMLEPNDTYYSYQEHYRQIRLPQAWDITTGTPDTGEVIVAVIDTGLATDHEDFAGQLVTGYDFISDPDSARDGDGLDADPYDPGTSDIPGESAFHGTHVAGTIAAATNNSRGVAGVSWGAKIMPLRVLGLGGAGTSYDIEQAVRYAARMTNDSGTLPAQAADIINLSLGGEGYVQASQDLYTQVVNRGVIIIAAAGNNNTSTLFYPASYNGVVSVSAMDWDNNRAPYSNYGSAIDIAAPGGDLSVDNNGDGYSDGILSCVINDTTGDRQSNYRFLQGTSMASPHVAGVVALMKAVYPDLTPAILDSMLTGGEMTNDLGDTGRDDIYGYGMIDALKSVQAAVTAAGQPVVDTAIVSPTSFNFGSLLDTTSITLSGQGSTPPSVVSINTSETWLTVTADSVDASGLGTYTLTVDRTDLVDAVYTATADFALSDGDTLSVSVSMRVQTLSADIIGNAGHLYIVLFDLAYGNQGQVNLSPSNGVYDFQISGIPAGDYKLIAGSDVDNDGSICEVGESCGAYPISSQEEIIRVDSNITGLDFLATINSGLGGAASLGFAIPAKGIPINIATDRNQKVAP